MLKENRQARPVAFLTACVRNFFREQGSPPLDPDKLLPFPPARHYTTLDESISVLDSFFGGVAHGR